MTPRFLISLLLIAVASSPANAEGEWEITRDSEQALERGLEWLAKNQGRDGNWSSNDVGLVSLGALAFLANGHAPGRGKYGEVVQAAARLFHRQCQADGVIERLEFTTRYVQPRLGDLRARAGVWHDDHT